MRKPCSVPECGRPNVGRGLCSRHYQQMLRHGKLLEFDTRILQPMFEGDKKTCGECKKELPIEAFKMNATKLNPHRRHSVCRECQNNQRNALNVKRKAAGLCVQCENPVVPGSNKCQLHIRERARWRSTPEARITELLVTTRLRAEENGLEFNLDAEWFRTRLSGVCELTGLPFDLEPGRRRGRFNPYAPSIDRIIAGSHYTKTNCRMVVMAINVGMNFWGEEIYKHVASAYFKQRRARKEKREANPSFETLNLLLENPQSVRVRKH
jgi:hypothetical protein